jgi:glycosyltransferase involved in cell wall biosynthesis
MQPLISVVIPAYNAAVTIRRTVRSVLAQTHRAFEVIVVNDGSSDETAAIAQSAGDSRVRMITVPNKGPAASRNRGFAISRGEYIAFLDADDLWTSEKLADQLEALRRYPAAGVAYSWTDYIDEHSEPFCSGSHRRYQGNGYAPMLVSDFLENGSNALLRRKIAEALGGFDEQVPWGAEDWDYFIRAARLTEFVCVPKSQILYRTAPKSVSS